ncbi:MAG: DUF58 domain-containing protein [Pseudomonadales bacterium]|nr:DUF58 domain-containing protein [Pseudomonadales bacterium]
MMTWLRRRWQTRWSRWLQQRLPPAQDITLDQRRVFVFLSRAGWLYLLLLLALFIGGINYANNLLLGLCFWLGSLLVVAILHTFRNLSGLGLRALGSDPGQAGQHVGLRVGLRSVSGRDYHAIMLHWQQAEQRIAYVGREQQVIEVQLPALRRGYMHLPRLMLETRWPLGLIRAWTWIDLDMVVLVWPRSQTVTKPMHLQQGQAGLSVALPGDDELDHLDAYRLGDAMAHIAWKHYARTSSLLVKRQINWQGVKQVIDFKDYRGLDREAVLSRMAYAVLNAQGTWSMQLPGEPMHAGEGEKHRLQCLLALAAFEAEHYRI